MLAVVCLFAASSAQAQDDGDPSANARFQFGALRFTPSVALSNLGVDNNVFNDTEDPKSDRTAAVGPAVDLWLNAGKARLSGKVSAQYLYYNKYASQRAWNTADSGRLEIPLNRIRPFLTGSLSNTKDRPGYEIDSRVRLRDTQFGAGVGLRLSGKTEIVVGANRGTFQYDNADVTLGDQISRALDRTSDSQNVDLRIRLTPLTTFVVRTQTVQDRFDNSPERDADSLFVMPGFELKPEALISGEVFVGVRRFDAIQNEVPDFTGVVARVGARYTVRATRLALEVGRDLQFSYEPLQPYYTQLNVGGTVTQRITSAWDLVGRGGRQSLAYQNLTGLDLPERIDRTWQYGGGIGYRFGESLRLGVDATYYTREAPDRPGRNYDGLRIGASFTYGLTQ